MTSRSEEAIVEHVQRALAKWVEAEAALTRAKDRLRQAAEGGSSISIRSAIAEYESATVSNEQARLSWEEARMLAVVAGVEV